MCFHSNLINNKLLISSLGLAALHDSIEGGLAALPINVIAFLEGEEEVGSKGVEGFLTKNKEIFDNAKLILCADGAQPRSDIGGIQLSNRGGVSATLDVKGANNDLHSGTYGGSILNPLVAAARIIASMHDPYTNKIAIANYYDEVIELTPEERAELDLIDDEKEAAMLGVPKMSGEVGKFFKSTHV